MNKKIIYIDYASKGNAGLYSFNILRSCSSQGNVTAYLHSDFKQDIDGVSIVRLFSRFESRIENNIVKNIYKWIDLYFSFLVIYIKCLRESNRHELYFLVQFHQSFQAYSWLFRKLSRLGKLYVTVHDAVELEHSYPSLIMTNRDRLLKYSDVLIVHNEQSEKELNYLNVPLLKMPFPLMVSNFRLDPLQERQSRDKVRFLFIGHIRKEKGVSALIHAWKSLPDDLVSKAELTIAGNNAADDPIDISGLINCVAKIGYISDDEFSELILRSHYVVMPYIGGTNSGVLSVATALRRPSITSKLPIFTESQFYEEELSFSESHSLCDLLGEIILGHTACYDRYLKRLDSRICQYESEFDSNVSDLFKYLLSK